MEKKKFVYYQEDDMWMGCVLIRHGRRHDWYQNPNTKMCSERGL